MYVKPFMQRRYENGKAVNAIRFGILDGATGLWFRWCYVHENFANQVAQRLSAIERTASDTATNWCRDPQQAASSTREDMRSPACTLQP